MIISFFWIFSFFEPVGTWRSWMFTSWVVWSSLLWTSWSMWLSCSLVTTIMWSWKLPLSLGCPGCCSFIPGILDRSIGIWRKAGIVIAWSFLKGTFWNFLKGVCKKFGPVRLRQMTCRFSLLTFWLSGDYSKSDWKLLKLNREKGLKRLKNGPKITRFKAQIRFACPPRYSNPFTSSTETYLCNQISLTF